MHANELDNQERKSMLSTKGCILITDFWKMIKGQKLPCPLRSVYMLLTGMKTQKMWWRLQCLLGHFLNGAKWLVDISNRNAPERKKECTAKNLLWFPFINIPKIQFIIQFMECRKSFFLQVNIYQSNVREY